jgi:hypothetical protein
MVIVTYADDGAYGRQSLRPRERIQGITLTCGRIYDPAALAVEEGRRLMDTEQTRVLSEPRYSFPGDKSLAARISPV